MKKIIKLMMVSMLILCLVACGNKEEETSDDELNETTNEVTNDETIDDKDGEDIDLSDDNLIKEDDDKNDTEVVEEATSEFNVDVLTNDDSKTYTFSRRLTSVKDLEALNLSDEYLAACAIVFTLAEYEYDVDKAIEMLEFINGPEDVSDYDKSFIKNQAEQYPYVMRSYFDGTSPENNYEINESVSITIKENSYSRDEDGYVKLLLHSSGADSDRAVTVRHKESTDQWFLFSDTYKSLMAGIRMPASEDKWN